MDVPNSPTRHRTVMTTLADQHPTNGLGGANGWATMNGNGHGHGHAQQRKGGWGIFEEKRRFGSSWLASIAPRTDEKDLLRTSKPPSLWQGFHLFEAPRRRGLTSPDAPPSTLRFCLLCALWYSSSAMSSNTGKAILTQFRYPITLTFVQFGFVAVCCLLFASPAVRFTRIRRPTRAILESTIPMGVFQVGGHIFSSMAISRITVSTVHTIKALSPLFTVAAYAMLFNVKYSPKTYISLLPLTIGVMLACSSDMSASNALGLLCAFSSAIVFVSSNIFFKKIMPSSQAGTPQTSAHKLDKLNLLFYSSSMAFLLMIPIWLYYDLPALLSVSEHVSHPKQGHSSPHSVVYYFLLNGTVHFAQSIIAFIILSTTSPVTYSIASLFKRVAVICIAILWFNQSVHSVQGFGICLTFAGLWMYNSAKADVEKGEKKMRRVEAAREMILPSTKAEHRMMHAINSPALSENEEEPISVTSAIERPIYAPPISTNGQTHSLHPPPPPSHTHPLPHIHIHHGPNLHIKVTPPKPFAISSQNLNESPTDSYPSPPLSDDDPLPATAIPSSPPGGRSRRRGTVSHNQAHHTPHHHHVRALSQESVRAPVANHIYVKA